MFLDERKRKIMGAVVRDYVETIKPIGSEDLASRHDWGIKSATIRNELADLAEMGLLRQPHTSAGRIPSDLGYRYYVDHLLIVRPVRAAAVRTETALDLDRLLRQTCALLTQMTSYTAVATPPRPADTRLSRLFLSPAGDGRLLLVALFSAGQMENRLVGPFPGVPAPDAAEIVALGDALQESHAGRTLDSIRAQGPPAAPPEFGPGLRALFAALAAAAAEMTRSAASEDSVVVEGTGEILRQPEFRDVGKIETVLDTLQRRTVLYQALSQAMRETGVSVVIGSENPVESMRECSVVAAPYTVGPRQRGTIGVVGPTRMDYDRAIPAVSLFAQALSDTLSRLGGL